MACNIDIEYNINIYIKTDKILYFYNYLISLKML